MVAFPMCARSLYMGKECAIDPSPESGLNGLFDQGTRLASS